MEENIKDKLTVHERLKLERGEIMRAARKSKKISIKKLSKIIGCTQAHLSNMERGVSSPGRELEDIWCDELGFKVTYLSDESINDMQKLSGSKLAYVPNL